MSGTKPGWNLKVRVWVERNGQKVLGPGRSELLGHIVQYGSISAAARKMQMSYRRAWGLVRSMNQAAGTPLVEVAAGGLHGGGARLTPDGRRLLAEYRRLVERLARAAAPNRFQKARA